MRNNLQVDSWYTRVEKIKNFFGIKRLYCKPDKAGLVFDKLIKSNYDRFYLDQINQTKIGNDGIDHNKLRN